MNDTLIEAIARAIRDFPMAQRLSAATAMKVVEDLRIAGYAIVPVEPTEAMIDAAYDAHDAYEAAEPPAAWCGLSSAYRAMINAAQAPHIMPPPMRDSGPLESEEGE